MSLAQMGRDAFRIFRLFEYGSDSWGILARQEEKLFCFVRAHNAEIEWWSGVNIDAERLWRVLRGINDLHRRRVTTQAFQSLADLAGRDPGRYLFAVPLPSSPQDTVVFDLTRVPTETVAGRVKHHTTETVWIMSGQRVPDPSHALWISGRAAFEVLGAAVTSNFRAITDWIKRCNGGVR